MSFDQEAGSLYYDCECEGVFMGPLTMEEIKYRLNIGRHTFGFSKDNEEKEDQNDSLRLIETHSTPNLIQSTNKEPPIHQISSDISSEDSDTFNCQKTSNDDSFLSLEIKTANETIKLVPPKIIENTSLEVKEHSKSTNHFIDVQPSNCETNLTPSKPRSDCIDQDKPSSYDTNKTPSQQVPKSARNSPKEAFSTPLQEINRLPFKTPGVPVSQKKLYATPSKRFEHIKSPVAAYINQSTVTPIMREVHPKKQLHGLSSIPKLVKTATQRTETCKENLNQDDGKLRNTNIKLPSIAYRSAKKTEVIQIPEVKKMPRSQWAQKLESSIPRVLKHQHREINHLKKLPSINQEDSFADLSLHQADLSVCTSKSAYGNK